MIVLARRQLRSHSRRWLLYPVFRVLALAALGGAYQTVAGRSTTHREYAWAIDRRRRAPALLVLHR